MQTTLPKPYLIAIDWGTSSFRARTISYEGKIIDCISTNDGILNAAPHFEKVLFKHITHLQGYSDTLPIVMSGMIGSKNGWHEIPYITLPCDASTLAANILSIPNSHNANIILIPGVYKIGDDADVIRGEETEIVGAINALNLTDASMIITGTHSKVATIKNGKLVDFKTFLTGEMFYALRQSTILGAFKGEVDSYSIWFKKGVEKGFHSKHSGELLNHIFLARTNVLCGDLPPECSLSFLSGILIGSEIGASDYKHDIIWIMGNGKLPQAYSNALQHLGFTVKIVPENTVIQGTLAIFKHDQELSYEK
ncbi:2-dehydro-3-deoxygalactonokinase [Spirabiliibacterium falconis]|uniref:2-dehydro-3-deoxygalactonokinase n=1 Tax=Spirabiliibacterium falconis TaxID=572023 RepID=UPI001AAD0D8A|nr:2-dehydro-3-deoxygalactonokinase [Spirabiliibacterium falconis]MBE2893499.1 2-dehydro-3-deoxygalactonokinase [Spirabiliibacterium falconis]